MSAPADLTSACPGCERLAELCRIAMTPVAPAGTLWKVSAAASGAMLFLLGLQWCWPGIARAWR